MHSKNPIPQCVVNPIVSSPFPINEFAPSAELYTSPDKHHEQINNEHFPTRSNPDAPFQYPNPNNCNMNQFGAINLNAIASLPPPPPPASTYVQNIMPPPPPLSSSS